MPLYEYKCEKCGNQFEKIEKHSAPTTQKCPKCGAKAQRMISAAGIQFKGSGWYVTDYKGKSRRRYFGGRVERRRRGEVGRQVRGFKDCRFEG